MKKLVVMAALAFSCIKRVNDVPWTGIPPGASCAYIGDTYGPRACVVSGKEYICVEHWGDNGCAREVDRVDCAETFRGPR